MIVADTGAIVALLDADDRHHEEMRELFHARSQEWLLPWAILPEVDYLVLTHLGPKVELSFLADLADGLFRIEWGQEADLDRARDICTRYKGLKLGLVDGIVMAVAERRRAKTIATLDQRHFGAVKLQGSPQLFPRDF